MCVIHVEHDLRVIHQVAVLLEGVRHGNLIFADALDVQRLVGVGLETNIVQGAVHDVRRILSEKRIVALGGRIAPILCNIRCLYRLNGRFLRRCLGNDRFGRGVKHIRFILVGNVQEERLQCGNRKILRE